MPVCSAGRPRLFAFNSLSFDIDLEAPPPREWLAFLNSLWPDDPASIALLQEWAGYALTGDTSMQKALLAVGRPRSGKSTIAAILRALVGEGNAAGPTLAGLAENFGLSALLGKQLAIVADARLSGRADATAVTERVLSITGEDAVTI